VCTLLRDPVRTSPKTHTFLSQLIQDIEIKATAQNHSRIKFMVFRSHIKSSRKGIISKNNLKKKRYGNEGHRQLFKSLGQKDI